MMRFNKLFCDLQRKSFCQSSVFVLSMKMHVLFFTLRKVCWINILYLIIMKWKYSGKIQPHIGTDVTDNVQPRHIKHVCLNQQKQTQTVASADDFYVKWVCVEAMIVCVCVVHVDLMRGKETFSSLVSRKDATFLQTLSCFCCRCSRSNFCFQTLCFCPLTTQRRDTADVILKPLLELCQIHKMIYSHS